MVIRDKALFCRSVRNTIIGAVIAWGIGALTAGLLIFFDDVDGLTSDVYQGHGIYFGISINNDQILSRGPPAEVSLCTTMIIAMFSGITIGLGQSSGVSNALSGVTLAASLLPPLVNCGLMTILGFRYPGVKTISGSSLHEIALVSLGMYCVTVPIVMVFAFITFKSKHIGGLSFRLGSSREAADDEAAERMDELDEMVRMAIRSSEDIRPDPFASGSADSYLSARNKGSSFRAPTSTFELTDVSSFQMAQPSTKCAQVPILDV